MFADDDRLKFNQQIQMIRFVFLVIVDHFDFAKCQTIQPINRWNLSVPMFFRQFGQTLHLIVFNVFSFARRSARLATVCIGVFPYTQVKHSLTICATFAKKRNCRSANYRRFSRSSTVENGQREHRIPRNVTDVKRQCNPFIPTVISCDINLKCTKYKWKQFKICIFTNLERLVNALYDVLTASPSGSPLLYTCRRTISEGHSSK